MCLPRPTAWLVAAAVIGALTGCSNDAGDDGGDAGAAHTTACRTYLLGVAGQDEWAAALLAQAERASSWNPDSINASLDAVREAAQDAGLVDGLSDDDFAVYAALADAAGVAFARTNPEGGPGPTVETVNDFRSAAEAVRSACDSD